MRKLLDVTIIKTRVNNFREDISGSLAIKRIRATT